MLPNTKNLSLLLLLLMGQMMRIMSYDRGANERNAIPGLTFLGQALKWHRLDDGVMGGQSETLHSFQSQDTTASADVDADAPQQPALHFTGQINTNGGGFCSIRSPIAMGTMPSTTAALRIRHVGDGKTYKFLMSDGNKSTFGPSRRSPSWQVDLPTSKEGVEETSIVGLESFVPSVMGGGGPRVVDRSGDDDIKQLDPTQVSEMGFMLSLKLSNGQPNPVETYGSGIFPFSLKILSIEPVSAVGEVVSDCDAGKNDSECKL